MRDSHTHKKTKKKEEPKSIYMCKSLVQADPSKTGVEAVGHYIYAFI